MFSQTDSTYGPSMLIDMEDGRPTEGEHTIGYLGELATKVGISARLLTAGRCNLQGRDRPRSQVNLRRQFEKSNIPWPQRRERRRSGLGCLPRAMVSNLQVLAE